MGTQIKVSTLPYEFKGFLGRRNFMIETADGRRIAWANSVWTHLAISNGLPVRLKAEDIEPYGLCDKLDMDYAPRKMKLPAEMVQQGSFAVQKQHLDSNHHVNNCQYVCMAADLLPEDFKILQTRAEYKMQATLGDILYPKVCEDMEAGKVTVSLEDQEGRTYAVVEFIRKPL